MAPRRSILAANRSRPKCPTVVEHVDALRAAVTAARQKAKSIGFVPTMGAFHDGHISLVQAARAECDFVVVSIFVNPTQFGPHEDYSQYPRDLEADLQHCIRERVDLVFLPNEGDVYPPNYRTYVEVEGLTNVFEGEFRPGHFRGVATIVLKLLNMVAPDVAYFGHKDYQQSLVVRRMVRDLNLPIRLRVCPTVREPDGLACSSRNRYLSPDERKRALTLYRSLTRARELVEAGERDAQTICLHMRDLFESTPGVKLDYADLIDPETLEPVRTLRGATLGVVAARVGGTRLIDNLLIVP